MMLKFFYLKEIWNLHRRLLSNRHEFKMITNDTQLVNIISLNRLNMLAINLSS